MAPAAPQLTTSQPLLIIAMNPWNDLQEQIAGGRVRHGAGFKPAWNDPTLRDQDASAIEMAISAWWRVSPYEVRRRGIDHAVATYRGLTRGLAKIGPDSWEQADNGRWGFIAEPITTGSLFDEVVGPHGHLVVRAKGAQNPILYWPRR